MSDIFLTLSSNLIPLYILVGLGYIAGRWLDVNLQSIARLLLFIILPVVVFGAIMRMNFELAYLILPFIFWAISLLITAVSYKLGLRLWPDGGNANLLGAGSVNGNAFYFGLPLILQIFGPALAGIYVFMNLGPMINNMSLAYFLTARGQYNIRDSLSRLVRFPPIHAAWLGVLLNLSGWSSPDIFTQYWEYATGTMTILGMMMIGISIGKLRKLDFDWQLTIALFVTKFMLWPLAIFGVVIADRYGLGLLSGDIHRMMMVFSVMPLMGNLVAYAAEHDLNPARAATAVLASTFFTLIIIPAMLILTSAY